MPKCDSCGNFFDDANNLELVRNKDNRWISLCQSCSERGVDVNQIATSKIAVDESAMALADKPRPDFPALTGDPIANAQNLLESLRNLRQAAEKVGRVRAHKRHNVELTVKFSLMRDDIVHEGIVRDLSKGGIRLNTRLNLEKGQIIQFDWKPPLPPALANILQGTAEVRRIIKNGESDYDVGLRFINRTAGKGVNRRRFHRYKCNMRAYYQRSGSEIMALGHIKDISQGGCRMMTAEPLDPEERLSMRIMGSGIRGELVAQVCRIIPREAEYEIGCSFVHTGSQARTADPSSIIAAANAPAAKEPDPSAARTP